MQETELIIEGIDFPPHSSRSCRQSLVPVRTGAMRRTINGELCYVGHKNFHKYYSVIECQDVHAPAFNDVWIGSIVTVHCCQYIWQRIDTDQLQVDLLRKPRTESLNLKKILGDGYNLVDSRKICLTEKLKQPIFFKYMPVLSMRIRSFSQVNQEWNQTTNWRIELEEI